MKVGIVGGGQLGLMLAEAAKKLGVDVIVLDPTLDCPASKVASQVIGDFAKEEDVLAFAKQADVLTFEIESANAQALEELVKNGYPVHPSPETLSIIKDKLKQKQFLTEHGIPVAPFVEVKEDAKLELEYPFVLKTRSGGYDGRGNATVRNDDDLKTAFEKLAGKSLYAEAFVPFQKELAVVAVRDTKGNIMTYPVVETVHENHICTEVLAPAPVSEDIKQKAEKLAERVLAALGGAGVFGIEIFLADGEVLVNEIAPRVHNSGHFTIEACETSQFENHIRAVCGMPLGSTDMIVPSAVMVNILGDRTGPAEPSGIEKAESLGGITVHIYGKHETKPARKMGHLTAIGNWLDEVKPKAEEARRRVSI